LRDDSQGDDMINFACRHYKGSKPCVYNKLDGSECPTCSHASEYRERVLFIKLDAIGDVFRSQSLLPAIMARHQAPYMAWLTGKESAPLVRMMRDVDEVIELSAEGIARATAGDWHQIYSLSNDLTSASLATLANRRGTPVGFYMRDGVITPSNEAAMRWLEMGAFDRLKATNPQTYQRRMLDILGAPEDAAIPAPALKLDETLRRAAAVRIAGLFGDSARPRVAINIGSSVRWPKKMLYPDQIYHFARVLRERTDVDVLLLGGNAETEKAAAILSMRRPSDRIEAALTGNSVVDFLGLLSEVDALLCGDTLSLHIAPALGLPTVAVFGPTSFDEIHTFDGLIVKSRARGLDCFVCQGDCQKQQNCMTLIDLDELVELTVVQLQRGADPALRPPIARAGH
jgi:ADP-heptose:LPS heptosyltransferase